MLLHFDDGVLGQGVLVYQVVQLERKHNSGVSEQCWNFNLGGEHGKAVAVFAVAEKDPESARCR